MNIAMMTNNYKPFIGGVPISIERLSNDLTTMGDQVVIFAPTYEGQIEEENIIRYKSFKKKIAAGMVVPNILDAKIEKAFRQNHIDIIHVHHPNCIGWSSLYLGKRYNIPVVYTYHTRYEHYVHNLPLFKAKAPQSLMNFMQKKFIPSAMKNFINHCDRVIAPTYLMQEKLEEMGVMTPIDILPTGIPQAFFEPDQEKVDEISLYALSSFK